MKLSYGRWRKRVVKPLSRRGFDLHGKSFNWRTNTTVPSASIWKRWICEGYSLPVWTSCFLFWSFFSFSEQGMFLWTWRFFFLQYIAWNVLQLPDPSRDSPLGQVANLQEKSQNSMPTPFIEALPFPSVLRRVECYQIFAHISKCFPEGPW